MKLLFQLIQFILPVLPTMLIALVFSILCILSSVGLMAAAAYLIASAALHPPLYELSLAIVGVRFFGIARAVFRYAERYLSHDATFCILGRLRHLCYERIEALVPAPKIKVKSSELCGILLQQIDTLKDFYLRVLAPILTAIIVLTSLAILFTFYAPHLSCLLISAFFLIGIVIPYSVHRKNRRSMLAAKSYQNQLNNQCIDAMQGIAELTAWNQTSTILAEIKKTTDNASRHHYKTTRITALTDSLSEAVASFAIVAALYLLIPLVRENQITGIHLAVLTLILQSSFEAAFALPAAWHYYISSMHAASQLFSLPSAIHHPIRPNHTTIPSSPSLLLAVDHLQFSYPDGSPVINGLSFSLQAGERIAIVGASGAGKSTLTSLLLNLYPIENIPIKLNGQLYQNLTPDKIRHNFNVVTQETHIFHETIQDNLQILHPNATGAEMQYALNRAELGDFIATLPYGIHTQIGQNGKQLSGGQRQRLSLARAFLRPAPILLLDEPTKGLDRLTAEKIMQTIFRLQNQQSIILITHDLTALAQMDRILVLHGGKIAEQGNYHDLVNQHGLFWHMLQFS